MQATTDGEVAFLTKRFRGHFRGDRNDLRFEFGESEFERMDGHIARIASELEIHHLQFPHRRTTDFGRVIGIQGDERRFGKTLAVKASELKCRTDAAHWHRHRREVARPRLAELPRSAERKPTQIHPAAIMGVLAIPQ